MLCVLDTCNGVSKNEEIHTDEPSMNNSYDRFVV